MHISSRDLNLLVTLRALLSEGSVTGAARRLGVTQPAVSRSLARLRATLGDELFVRTSRGLRATQRATDLSGPLVRALAELESLLAASTPFDPRTARRKFRIAAVDYAQVALLAPLAVELEREQSTLDLEIHQPSAQAEHDLETGALDLLIAPRQPSAAGIVWTPLHDDGYTCIVWRDHPCRRLTLRSFAELEHVLVAPRERPGGVVDEVLAGHGLSRRVAVQVPTFLIVPHVLIGTRRIATIPKRMAALLARVHPLRVLAPPVEIPGFTMAQAWHEVHRADPGHVFLRTRLAEAARGSRTQRGRQRRAR